MTAYGLAFCQSRTLEENTYRYLNAKRRIPRKAAISNIDTIQSIGEHFSAGFDVLPDVILKRSFSAAFDHFHPDFSATLQDDDHRRLVLAASPSDFFCTNVLVRALPPMNLSLPLCPGALAAGLASSTMNPFYWILVVVSHIRVPFSEIHPKDRRCENRHGVRILGIESSCDETAAAVVEDGSSILSSIVSSQMATHAKYGGVVPELASREHLRAIVPAVRLALETSATRLDQLAAIAVTQGPGLVGSLLVGITYAKALSAVEKIPLIAVNHIEGHIHAVASQFPVEYPALALVVSGGHTHLYEVREGFEYRLLGKTRDDAAGEAFDKVAKLLGFGYPGGPVIDRLAPYGDPRAVRFTLAKMKGNALDFSFSGIKTAVLRWVEARGMEEEIAARRAILCSNHAPAVEDWLKVTPRATLDLLASFQRTVIEELLRRAERSAEEIGARALIVSGGVACNSGLRRAAAEMHLPYPVYFPSPALSTDNAAMIAAAGFVKLRRGEFADLGLKAAANLRIA
jgi:N6-L-threonylcarbamoyladenine synthase